jgi:nucleotide-binding universal stress UspA family protein
LSEARRLKVELIVVDSHGHGLLFDALLGSVSAAVLRHADVPVLVVPVRGM